MEGETATSGVGEGRQQVSHTPAPRSRHIPEDVNGNPVTSDMQLQGPRGGPRLISINRTDQGFGFTLRHFIVYPPELSELLSDDGSASAAVPLSSLDPLDTIFVKHVKLGSPAHLAGLRTGDRVVSVNGEGVGSRSYQEVVATIQRSPPTLHLMVVPRQQDLLQQVFGETAHNPESNLDIRMPSPGLLPLQHPIRHPLTASLTHASLGGSLVQYPPSLSQSTWSSQSSLTSHLSTMSTGHHPPTVMVAHPPFHQKSHQSPKVSQPHGAHIPILPHQQLTIHGNHSSVPYWPGTRKHSLSSGDNQTAVTSSNRKQSLPGMADRRQAVYTIQNSLSSVPHYVPSKSGKPSPLLTSTNLPGSSTHASSNEPSNASVFGIYEPILDRAIGRGKVRDSRRLECDPDGRVYEVVHTRVVESKLNSNGNKKGTVKKGTTGVRNNSGSHHDRKSKVGGEADAKRVRVQSLSPPRLKVDQIHARSASVHPRPERPSVISSSNNVLLHGSHQSLSSTKNEALTRSGNKHNSYSRRSCTEPIISNKENSQTNDKSTQEVIDRIKKNVERKEEFLKRPNQPIWLPASKAPIIHSDYHVNPQRLPRPMWPPPAAQTPPSPGSVTKALSFIVSPKQDQTRKVKPDTEQAQPLDSSASVRGTNVPGSQSSLQNDGKTESSIDPVLPSGNEITNHAEIQNLSSAQSASTVLPRSLVGNAVPKPYSGSTSEANPANARYGKAFVTTLSRIQENIAIPELGSSSSLTSQGLASSKQGDTSQGVTPGGTPSGSETSLNSSIIRPIPLAWVGDNERIKQLQIVSKRAKQFESSQLEKEASCKSAFHRFELSRLSQRSKIPNVAQRKQEFEKRDNDQLPLGFEYEFGTHYNNSPRQRKSAELVRSNLVSQELSPSPAKVFRSLSDGGNVFPVSRRLYSPGHDEGRNSSSVVEESTGLRYGMNRTIPVGGPNIHCTPPSHRPHSDSGVLERERSNSVCSQVSMTSLWSTQSMDETGTNRQKSVARQNSYLSALRSPLPGDEGERLVRRVSYLKATSGDRMYSDSDLDSDNDDRSGVRGEGVVRAAGGEAPPEAPTGPVCVRELPSPASLQSAIVRQGALHVKLTMVDGKKAGDRSWKAAWALLQGHAIIFYKDRQHAIQTPLGVEEQISLRGAEVEVASDYTKRRNVLRLATPGGSQLLLQADTPPEMLAWLSTLQNNCALQEGESGSKTPMNNNNVSPQTSNKAMRKLTSTLRTRSPTGQSPSTKTRKPSSSESNSSPKSKTWRGHLKRPFMKKVHSGSPAITPTMPLPEGATIGVCLEDCPPSLENEYVPLLVALCVGVVEGRGLQTQGIYRIPGNKAAVTHLTEMINKDPKSIEYDDPRWCDVNVISSMLKQFFQKLPDPLFTIELYPLFIEASKIEDPSQRMVELKKLVQELPYHHYETLRFLIMHLNNIVSHSDMNKMDVRNLAIVFGPTLVRSGDDNMVTMVTDMSHQCRIVETLISQAAWFFSEDDGEEIVPPVLNHSVLQSPAGESLPPSETDTPSSQALLLHNIQKVEGNIKADMKKDIVSSIISAANRKVHKVKCKKAIEDKPIDDSRHSDKDGGFEERDIDKEAELRKQRLLAKQIESMVELPDPKPMSERKISNMSLMSVQSHSSGVSNFSQNLNNDRTSGSEATKLSIPGDIIHPFCVVKKDGVSTNSAPSTLPTSSTIENTATSTQQSSQLAPETTSLFGDEVAIRSYAGLSASTQERIRRFEMETRAMLHRDLTRHRRETERRDVERQRLEELWQRAKQDMESEDILDQMADNPTEVVRKISDLSWRLQGLRESVDGDRGSLASQSSSPQAALISAALSHHPLSNTSLTPTTNSTTQVPNNYSQPPVIKVVSEPSVGMACDVTNDGKHGMMQQSSLPWLDYNAASPHSTLGSTSSSGSSGYGSLTRSSQASNPCDAEDTIARAVEDICSAEASKTTTKPCTVSQHSSPLNSKKKKSGFLFGLTSSSSSPSLFPSMAEAAAELTPTRKIGQTTIYPESPRPPPHNAHCSSQSQLTVPSTTLIPHPNTPLQGRHKDSILHHILPSRLYHSPRPLRRGSSAENVAQPIVTPLSPSTFDNQMVANNGTLKRARTSRDQILNGPETGMPRCGSLDSLRDGPHIPHDDGSDLLSAITATFEEKMRSLQESHLGLVTAVTDDYISSFDPSSDVGQLHDHTGTTRGKTECRLYRDPSLHRRRTNPRNPSLNASTSSSSSAANAALTSTISQVEAACQAAKFVENENKLLSEEVKCDVKVKRSDSLTKSEKTENNLKEKTEKRARELKRTDTQESLSEKKPKEMKRSDNLDGTERSRDLSKKSEVKDNSVGSTRRTSEVRSRRHNVKELKEKFEQNTSTPSSTNPMKPSTVYSNVNNNSTKTNKSSMRRTGYRGHIKRRHTVGGTKDLAKWAWLQSAEVSRNAPRSTRLSAWERLQPLVADERLNTDRTLEAWLAHERIRTSSPDLSRPQQLVLHCDMDDKENLHRRLSVQEATLNPLYPLLESHV
ncbi:rho GTPase-activating protein 21 isoform X1 [Procambarus clarkii]|uniref:rho GTPase-activating protein 21 isoform X1 n=2 Tax=Procambarus clarkii TaxID=6728 RepID=UPI0037425125